MSPLFSGVQHLSKNAYLFIEINKTETKQKDIQRRAAPIKFGDIVQ